MKLVLQIALGIILAPVLLVLLVGGLAGLGSASGTTLVVIVVVTVAGLWFQRWANAREERERSAATREP